MQNQKQQAKNYKMNAKTRKNSKWKKNTKLKFENVTILNTELEAKIMSLEDILDNNTRSVQIKKTKKYNEKKGNKINTNQD